jgi:hypothetical protein
VIGQVTWFLPAETKERLCQRSEPQANTPPTWVRWFKPKLSLALVEFVPGESPGSVGVSTRAPRCASGLGLEVNLDACVSQQAVLDQNADSGEEFVLVAKAATRPVVVCGFTSHARRSSPRGRHRAPSVPL